MGVVFYSMPMALFLITSIRRLILNQKLRCQFQECLELLQHFYKAVSDEERQRFILSAGMKTLSLSLVMLAWVMFFTGVIFVGPWLWHFNQVQMTNYLWSLSIVSIVGWIMCYIFNDRASSAASKPQPTYSKLDRYLHWIALQPRLVRQVSFDLERLYALPHQSIVNAKQLSQHSVYVCGLARSGTTMLLRVLDQIDVFRTLSYRDMPFVLAPNLWRLLTGYSSKKMALTERVHQDGILVDYDSPEAFEEVFWQTFSPNTSSDPGYNTARPTQDVIQSFADYRILIANPKSLATDAQQPSYRYLSKNNNNLLRLDSLTHDKTAIILLVYRNPIDTARSLHRLHQSFCATYQNDHFANAYMGWLGHHEFGPGHRPFAFACLEMDPSLTPEDPNYWLDYWCVVYKHVLRHNDANIYLVEHEAMRLKPREMIAAISRTLGVSAQYDALADAIRPKKCDISDDLDEFDRTLLLRAQQLHATLQRSTNNIRTSQTT